MRSRTSTSQHQLKRRFVVEALTPFCVAKASSEVVEMQCSMNWLNAAALVTSGRLLLTETPQALHRLRVVPLHLVSPPQWQRGRSFGIGPPDHRLLPRVGYHIVDFASEAQTYAREAYILRNPTGQNLKIPDLGHAL